MTAATITGHCFPDPFNPRAHPTTGYRVINLVTVDVDVVVVGNVVMFLKADHKEFVANATRRT